MLIHRLQGRRRHDAVEEAVVARELPPAAEEPRRDRRFSRFLGNRRVATIAVGVVAGASSLISIPLLAHHPGAPQVPATPPTVIVDPEPIAPATPEPPPPPVRAPLDPALTGFSGVSGRTLTEPFPGIRYLRFNAEGPHAVHVVDVDLTNPAYRVRVTKPDERGQTVSAFAQATNALVAINGDWFEYGSYHPHGLAVGEGQAWPGAPDLAEWLFLACDRAQRCAIDREGSAAGVDPAWQSAIGGNGVPLVVDGQPRFNDDPFYSSDRHPRSAVGLTRDGRMILVAGEGRQGDAVGLTFNEMARLLAELGAEQAMMLDGGGSTSLVLGGARVNDLPTGSGERAVANHLAIVPAPAG